MPQPWHPRLENGFLNLPSGDGSRRSSSFCSPILAAWKEHKLRSNIYLLADFENTNPVVRRFWVGRQSMNPRSAPPDNGAIDERPRQHAHTTVWDGKQLWPPLWSRLVGYHVAWGGWSGTLPRNREFFRCPDYFSDSPGDLPPKNWSTSYVRVWSRICPLFWTILSEKISFFHP